jgi:hypothetical protein
MQALDRRVHVGKWASEGDIPTTLSVADSTDTEMTIQYYLVCSPVMTLRSSNHKGMHLLSAEEHIW